LKIKIFSVIITANYRNNADRIFQKVFPLKKINDRHLFGEGQKMKTRRFRKSLIVGILLGLLPLYIYAAEVKDRPSQKTPEPKEEIIEMLKAKNEGYEEVSKDKSMSAALASVEDKWRVYFKKGSDALDPQAQTILNETVAWLKNNPTERLIIEGHGNEYKSREKNLMLGELRAGSVLSYLLKQGIGERRLTVVSYGSERSRNKRMARKYRVKNWRVCFLVVENRSIKGGGVTDVPEKSIDDTSLQKESKDKEPAKDSAKKEPVEVKKKKAVKEKKKEKPAKASVEKKIPKAEPLEDKKVDVATEPSATGKEPPGNNKISEAKIFFDKFTALVNNYDPKIMELYSVYAVIYIPDGPSVAQNQTGALILEKAKPILLEVLSKAKAQNASIDFSDVKYSLEGEKVCVRSMRNSKPYSLIIGKNAEQQWKIEEEVLHIQ